MQNQNILPHLFRTEYRKITSVLCKLFGIEHIEIAEDLASDTFLQASETWGLKGFPENPTAWLYTVAKNKARDYLKHHAVFQQKISEQLKQSADTFYELEIDLSDQNITDSQLQMMFAICNPLISIEEQIGLSLRILCGFGVNEIANAFLTNKETIKKRLFRAKEKLRSAQIKIEVPGENEIEERLDAVLRTLYLLFNEGYYSSNPNTVVRKDLSLEALRLAHLLTQNEKTDHPQVNALIALMCFQSSRLDARTNDSGEIILYHNQNKELWNDELISTGEYYLNRSSKGNVISKYHLEASIAFFHTTKTEPAHKWETILQLYNQLLRIEYSPIAALNRTYALSKANGKLPAIAEAEKLNLTTNHLYYTLLGELYSGIDNTKAISCYKEALRLTSSEADRVVINGKIAECE